MSDIYKQIGRRIMKARTACGMSQEELAGRMGYASTATISHFENGSRRVNIFALNKIARILNVSVADLIGYTRAELVRPEQASLKIDHPDKSRDVVLCETEYLRLVERDGWYYFAQVPGSTGGVAILLYRLNSDRPILGRYEICPAHGDGVALTAIAGGIEKGDPPLQAAVIESYEEGGYQLHPNRFIDLGKCQLSTNQDTVVYLFAADVTGLTRFDAPGDGTKGEEGAYCVWVSVEEAVLSKSAFMSALIARLKLIAGIDLL